MANMVSISTLKPGDKFRVYGSDTVFVYKHSSVGVSTIYHATLNGVYLMFNNIQVYKVKEPEEIPIIFSEEDIIANRCYTDVMLRNGFEYLGFDNNLVRYKCLKTGKVYSAPLKPNYESAHTIWLTEYQE